MRIHGGKYYIDFVVRMSSPLTKSSCSLWHKSRRLSSSNAEHATKDSFSACIHAHTETYISIFLSISLSLVRACAQHFRCLINSRTREESRRLSYLFSTKTDKKRGERMFLNSILGDIYSNNRSNTKFLLLPFI